MNNVFDPRRFGKYFLYDLTNAKNNYLASFIACAVLPVILYLTVLAGRLLSVGLSEDLWSSMGSLNRLRIFAVWMSSFIVMLTFPAKQYGRLTEKRAGSDWLMIPASTFEKFLSMLLLTCVVLPIALCAGLLISDGLLCLFAPDCQRSVLALIMDTGTRRLMEELNAPFNMSLGLPLYLNWCEGILFFTLGAIVFRRSKTAHTILSGFGILFALLAITYMFFGTVSIDSETAMTWFANLDIKKATFWINFIVNALYFVVFALLDAGLYFRLKTLKH